MRIEKRADGEWLVGAFGPPNDCVERSPKNFGDICTRHFNGEHLSCGEVALDGAMRIDARWPMVAVDGNAPASHTPRFLTPTEVRAAQVPYVAKEIERINAGLAMGVRSFSVNAPLFEEIKRGLWTAEWSVNGAVTMDGRTSFVVRVREEGE